MRNLAAILRRTAAIPLCVILLIGPTGYAIPADTHAAEKSSVTVLQVPTTGSILDVTYMPDFQEWWVKCREGDKIVVYSYERLIKTWRKVIFEAKKPDTTPTTKKPESSKPAPIPPATEQTEPARKEEPRPAAIKLEKKQEEARPDKTKWWDPILNIFKQK